VPRLPVGAAAEALLAVWDHGHHRPAVQIGSRSGPQREQAKEGRHPAVVFLQRWVINTLAMLVAARLVPGIDYNPNDLTSLFVASLLFGILVTFLRPLLFLLTLPLVVVTLGLFVLIINAGLLYLVGWLVKDGFTVAGFWPAFWGALVISIVSLILNTLTGTGESRVRVRRSAASQKPPGGDGGGPVIDV
jgi:putative membrane protein